MSRLFSQHINLYSPAAKRQKLSANLREIAGRASKPHCPAKKSAGEKRAGIGKPTKNAGNIPRVPTRSERRANSENRRRRYFLRRNKTAAKARTPAKMPQQRARGRSKARGHYPSTPLANRFRRFPNLYPCRRRSPALRPRRK